MRDTYGVTAMHQREHRQDHRRGLSHGGAPPPAIVTAGSTWNTVVENSATSRMPIDELGQPGQGEHDDLDDVSGRLPR